MAEVMKSYAEPVIDETGRYHARAVGRLAEDGMWDGWLEFESLDELGGNTGFRRRTWTRRNDDVRRRELLDAPHTDLVVAYHDRVAAELTDIAGEVVHERIVVVDEEDPGWHGRKSSIKDAARR